MFKKDTCNSEKTCCVFLRALSFQIFTFVFSFIFLTGNSPKSKIKQIKGFFRSEKHNYNTYERYKNVNFERSVKVILVQNHPSVEVMPSDADIELTDRLKQAGKIINIAVIDPLIITKRTYMSFADTRRMKELEESTKWVPPYALVEQIKKEEAKLRKEAVKIAKEKGEQTGIKKGEKQKAMEMAKSMLLKGYTLKEIMELTGLTKLEIERL